MLSFLQPILLWASAAITIPVLIHLWNVKQGKTLKVGSIALFAKGAASYTKSLRVKDRLLLLLRCLLIIVLTMLIAKPFWKQETGTNEKGWILIEKGKIGDAYQMYHTAIDMLLQQGYFIHYFNETFERADLKDSIRKETDSIKNTELPYWTLLKLVDQKLPAGFPVQLFTGNDLQQFTGNRPALSLQLTWHIIPAKEKSAVWLDKAYYSADGIQFIEKRSNVQGTYYAHKNLSLKDNDIYKISRYNNKFLLTDSTGQTIEADTIPAMTIVIHANGFTEDVNYLKAALNAIGEITQRKIKISVVDKKNIPSNADWIFWLSDEEIPSFSPNAKVFAYEKGEAKNTHSLLLANNETALTNSQDIPLYKYITNNTSSGQIIWKNSYGEPLLTRRNDTTSIYHFYSRFSPQWSDLVWNASFPQLLYNLLFAGQNESETNTTKDKRIIDSSQMQPQLLSSKYVAGSVDNSTKTDLSNLVWLIAFLLFFAERILSFRKQKTQQT